MVSQHAFRVTNVNGVLWSLSCIYHLYQILSSLGITDLDLLTPHQYTIHSLMSSSGKASSWTPTLLHLYCCPGTAHKPHVFHYHFYTDGGHISLSRIPDCLSSMSFSHFLTLNMEKIEFMIAASHPISVCSHSQFSHAETVPKIHTIPHKRCEYVYMYHTFSCV